MRDEERISGFRVGDDQVFRGAERGYSEQSAAEENRYEGKGRRKSKEWEWRMRRIEERKSWD